jgi:hypothetical protein
MNHRLLDLQLLFIHIFDRIRKDFSFLLFTPNPLKGANMTEAEITLWNKIKNRNIFKARFRRQHPIGISIVDFYYHENNFLKC